MNKLKLQNAKTECAQCREKLTGDLVIVLDDPNTLTALAYGSFYKACQDHHEKNKVGKRSDILQHDEFKIFIGEDNEVVSKLN